MFFVSEPKGHRISAVTIILPAAIFHLIGLCDVLLFVYTRRGLLLFPECNIKGTFGLSSGQTPLSPMSDIAGNRDTDDMYEQFGNHSRLSESEKDISIREEGRSQN